MANEKDSRRDFLKFGIAGVGSALLLGACGNNQTVNSQNVSQSENGKKENKEEKKQPDAKEVTAVEDLMREHGILRRALLVYSEAAVRLRKNPNEVSPEALQKTAKLFRAFGEDYHEKKLEEAYLFPLIKQKGAGSEAAKYADILVVQHNRGREITDYNYLRHQWRKNRRRRSGICRSARRLYSNVSKPRRPRRYGCFPRVERFNFG